MMALLSLNIYAKRLQVQDVRTLQVCSYEYMMVEKTQDCTYGYIKCNKW